MASSISSPDGPNDRLGRLPAELRCKIYVYLVGPRTSYNIDDGVDGHRKNGRVKYNASTIDMSFAMIRIYRTEFLFEALKTLETEPLKIIKKIAFLRHARYPHPLTPEMVAQQTALSRAHLNNGDIVRNTSTWVGALLAVAVMTARGWTPSMPGGLNIEHMDGLVASINAVRQWYHEDCDDIPGLELATRRFVHRASRHTMATSSVLLVLQVPEQQGLDRDELFRTLRDVHYICSKTSFDIRMRFESYDGGSAEWHKCLQHGIKGVVWD